MAIRAGHRDIKGKVGIVFDTPPLYGTTWTMYLRQAPEPNPLYVNYKLVANNGCRDKANYWLSWHTEREAFVASSDFLKMQQYRPDLLELVLAYLKLFA